MFFDPSRFSLSIFFFPSWSKIFPTHFLIPIISSITFFLLPKFPYKSNTLMFFNACLCSRKNIFSKYSGKAAPLAAKSVWKDNVSLREHDHNDFLYRCFCVCLKISRLYTISFIIIQMVSLRQLLQNVLYLSKNR